MLSFQSVCAFRIKVNAILHDEKSEILIALTKLLEKHFHSAVINVGFKAHLKSLLFQRPNSVQKKYGSSSPC